MADEQGVIQMATTVAAAVGRTAGWRSTASRTQLAKRCFDLVAASAALVVLSPVMVTAALLVRLTSPGSALFRQTRIGEGERPFTILKFRTMYADADDRLHREFNRRELLGDGGMLTGDGIFKPEHDPRLTPVGAVLRRYSIDELPQLINVLLGDMALVGPRPSLPWEVEMFTAEQRRRHRCRPGITGLWQVSGRNRLSMQEMLTLDVAYAEQPSLLADLAILLRAPRAVLFDHATR
jgi:lipopolysaccharide/colanic/teichoic acid biosynthesis glycosyltransferase